MESLKSCVLLQKKIVLPNHLFITKNGAFSFGPDHDFDDFGVQNQIFFTFKVVNLFASKAYSSLNILFSFFSSNSWWALFLLYVYQIWNILGEQKIVKRFTPLHIQNIWFWVQNRDQHLNSIPTLIVDAVQPVNITFESTTSKSSWWIFSRLDQIFTEIFRVSSLTKNLHSFQCITFYLNPLETRRSHSNEENWMLVVLKFEIIWTSSSTWAKLEKKALKISKPNWGSSA